MTNTAAIQQATAHTPEPWTKEYLPYVSNKSTGTETEIPCYRIHPLDTPEEYICETNEHLGDEVQYANARRICAAVNVCQGISTEALERGIIADLRHLLGELISAAGDLDAAIDGATDEFDAERTRLTAVLHAAQAILDGSMELDLHELLAGRCQIAVVWSIEDVQEVRPDLTDEQSWEVLQLVKRSHDCNDGVNWLTLEIAAKALFGYAPETATEEEQP